jgi:ubiquinone/menaquinone biosynthesis C-methylase UbiE
MSDRCFEFPQVQVSLDDLQVEGLILDIGGGGEGAVSQLHGREVVSIDRRMDELREAPASPGKVAMDARQLGFEDNTFRTATAFFTMMYISDFEDQQRVFEEANRVLKPGGTLHLWDVDLPSHHPEDTDYFVVYIRYQTNGEEHGTGYGKGWPDSARNEAHYIGLAEQAGLLHTRIELNHHTFYLQFKKPVSKI